MPATITLSQTISKTQKGTVSLKLDTTAFGMSSKVFAIEVYPKSMDPAAPNLRFSHVCSPAELVEFPEDEPLDNCYFRTSSIELVFDTDALLTSVIANMRADIANLVSEFNKLSDGADVDIELTTF